MSVASGGAHDFLHASINPRFKRLMEEEEKGYRSTEETLEEISAFIAEAENAQLTGTDVVGKLNLLNHLYKYYYELDRKIKHIPVYMLHG